MQSGKRQMRFGRDADSGEHDHPALASRARGLRKQTRLADTRLAAEHERLATCRDLVQARGQQLLFVSRPRNGAISSRAVPSMTGSSCHVELFAICAELG